MIPLYITLSFICTLVYIVSILDYKIFNFYARLLSPVMPGCLTQVSYSFYYVRGKPLVYYSILVSTFAIRDCLLWQVSSFNYRFSSLPCQIWKNGHCQKMIDRNDIHFVQWDSVVIVRLRCFLQNAITIDLSIGLPLIL